MEKEYKIQTTQEQLKYPLDKTSQDIMVSSLANYYAYVSGYATLVAGTATVATTYITSTSIVLLTVQSLGTVATPKAVGVTARSQGTSFTITSSDATDTSVVGWIIITIN